VVDGGEELSVREVARAAEDHQRRWVDREALEAHAWVEFRGHVVGDNEARVRTYSRFPDLTGPGHLRRSTR
jgi:hypothetical protein